MTDAKKKPGVTPNPGARAPEPPKAPYAHGLRGSTSPSGKRLHCRASAHPASTIENTEVKPPEAPGNTLSAALKHVGLDPEGGFGPALAAGATMLLLASVCFAGLVLWRLQMDWTFHSHASTAQRPVEKSAVQLAMPESEANDSSVRGSGAPESGDAAPHLNQPKSDEKTHASFPQHLRQRIFEENGASTRSGRPSTSGSSSTQPFSGGPPNAKSAAYPMPSGSVTGGSVPSSSAHEYLPIF